MYSFEGREWDVITEGAKDLISRMLEMDMHRRALAKDLLNHRWFQVCTKWWFLSWDGGEFH